MKMKVTAIFDIGKTNKKFFLFGDSFRLVHQEYIQPEETEDEDGFPTENLRELNRWIDNSFEKVSKNKKYEIAAVNFSTYGASFVHIDREGQPLTPLYNYLKPYPKALFHSFYKKYGPPEKIARETASPQLGMLNSGMQLYWLKHTRPEVYRKIQWSLHFPQYLSYRFSEIPKSDYTSIGCHTGLWDFEKEDYHRWVYEEKIDRILPRTYHSNDTSIRHFENTAIKIGTGIHDSSAALLPYLYFEKEPFLLISTGTWSISLNPFDTGTLSKEDLKKDCLNYMQIDGKPVKAARLFMGNEHDLQVNYLNVFFGKNPGYHRQIRFDENLYLKLRKDREAKFHFESIHLPRQQPGRTGLHAFRNYEIAYHRLMIELVELQYEAAHRAIGDNRIRKIYIDGGFSENELFTNLMARYFNNCQLHTSQSPIGSALGAALAVSDRDKAPDLLKKHYRTKLYSARSKFS